MELSSTIVDALLKRIALLNKSETEMLSYAALIGKKFSIDFFFSILEDYEKEKVVKIIDKAIDEAIIEMDEKGIKGEAFVFFMD